MAVGILTSLVVAMATMVPVAAQSGFISPSDNPQAVSAATGGTGSFRELAQRIVGYILGFLGFIAVVMIIYGGFLYISAAGKEDKIGTAKKIILYSVIGIVIILLSYAIVNTVLGAGTGAAAP